MAKAKVTMESKSETIKLKGNEYFKSGNYMEAIQQYSNAIKLCNNDKEIKAIKHKLTNLDYLSNDEILFFMKHAYNIKSNDGMTEQNRPDFIYRLKTYQKFINGEKLKAFKCKDLFGFDNRNQLLSILSGSAKQMGCHGNGYCDFKSFGIKINGNRDDRILLRFREWIQSGMCIHCQHIMFEQEY